MACIAALVLVTSSWCGTTSAPGGFLQVNASSGGTVEGGTAVAAALRDSGEAESGKQDVVSVKTDVVRASFDRVGGSLVKVELLKHHNQGDGLGQNVVVLERSADGLYVEQSGVLIAKPRGMVSPNHMTPMTVVSGEREMAEGQNVLKVRFESPDVPGGGIKLVKTFTFKRGDYTIGVRSEIVNTSGTTVTPKVYLQLVRDGSDAPGGSSVYGTFSGPAMYTEAGGYSKVDFKTIEKGTPEKPVRSESANNGWAAMVQHYFVSAWMVGSGAQEDATQKRVRELFIRKVEENRYAVGMMVQLDPLASGEKESFESRLFVGPQDEDVLSSVSQGLERVKDYGLFSVLSKPLFWLLARLYGLLGNWGWAIVGLVVLLKIVFYPLNAMAYRSMARMTLVSPKIVEMRERLKDKPKEIEAETMKIYRQEKINPLGGCLPILIQIPFFIALYWVVLSSVEMRNAPWVGWITDLSAKDPWFILPALMTASTLLQTWLNPQPPDATQAAMMWIMPLVFSAMFFFLPAGLVLFWLTNNVLSIAQQYHINKRLGVLKGVGCSALKPS